MRFALYESPSVSTRRFPFSATNQTGVDTGVPSRRKVVKLTYFPVKLLDMAGPFLFSGVGPPDCAVERVAEGLLARIVVVVEVQLVGDVRVSDVRVGVGACKRAARARRTEGARA